MSFHNKDVTLQQIDIPGGGEIWSLCITQGMTKDIRVISGAENSEQNDDKTNNLDDVIQFPLLVLLSILLSSIQQIAVDDKIP